MGSNLWSDLHPVLLSVVESIHCSHLHPVLLSVVVSNPWSDLHPVLVIKSMIPFTLCACMCVCCVVNAFVPFTPCNGPGSNHAGQLPHCKQTEPLMQVNLK